MKGKPSGVQVEMSESGKKKKVGGWEKDFKEQKDEGIIRAGKWESSVQGGTWKGLRLLG